MRRINSSLVASTPILSKKQAILFLVMFLFVPSVLFAQGGSPDLVDPGIVRGFGLGLRNPKPKSGVDENKRVINDLYYYAPHDGTSQGIGIGSGIVQSGGFVPGGVLVPGSGFVPGGGLGSGIGRQPKLSISHCFAHGKFSQGGKLIYTEHRSRGVSFSYAHLTEDNWMAKETFTKRYIELQKAAYEEGGDDFIIFLAGFVHYRLGHAAEAEREILRFLERRKEDRSATLLLKKIRAYDVPNPIPVEELTSATNKSNK